MKNAFTPTRWIGMSTTVLAIAALAACNKAEAPMDAPPASPPASAPAPEVPAPVAPSAPAAPSASTMPNTTVGEKIDDTVVTTKVKTALLADDTVKGMDIKVTTVGGEVQLSGVVDTQVQMDRAVEVAKAVEGAQRVQNGMTVKQ